MEGQISKQVQEADALEAGKQVLLPTQVHGDQHSMNACLFGIRPGERSLVQRSTTESKRQIGRIQRAHLPHNL